MKRVNCLKLWLNPLKTHHDLDFLTFNQFRRKKNPTIRFNEELQHKIFEHHFTALVWHNHVNTVFSSSRFMIRWGILWNITPGEGNMPVTRRKLQALKDIRFFDTCFAGTCGWPSVLTYKESNRMTLLSSSDLQPHIIPFTQCQLYYWQDN